MTDTQLLKDWDDDVENAPIDGASSDTLNATLHELTARRLVEALRDPERCTPGMIREARGFLKDNDVSGLPIPGSAHEELRRRYSDKVRFPRLASGDK